jgi:hypothetical protein
MTVVFPCTSFDDLSSDDRNRSLKAFREEVIKFVDGLPTGATVHSFNYGDVSLINNQRLILMVYTYFHISE